ncbi:MAG: hypothetical protein DHS20C17_09250 [Cyclobacteriaceae bacterium]|nr:MAG: hypothetical protein DHS20C17_09250 [Cyclobacteriaceae bacterium]
MKCGLNLFYLLLFFIFSCSSDEQEEFSLVGTNTSIAAMSGNWNATSAIFSKPIGQVMEVDIVAEGGTATLNIQSNGRFNLTITQQGESPEITTGDLRFDEDLLVVFFDDDPGEWEYFGISHNDPNLSIDDRNATGEFDFDGDGTLEPANLYFEFVRI